MGYDMDIEEFLVVNGIWYGYRGVFVFLVECDMDIKEFFLFLMEYDMDI